MRALDEINSVRDITDLMLRLGYAPPNVASQAAITLSAGVGPRAISLATRMSRHLDPESKAQIRGARGGGIAEAGLGPRTRGRVKTLRNWLANKWGLILDDPWRQSIFVKHAIERGYDTPDKMVDLMKPKNRDDMVEIAQRTRQKGLDYGDLSPMERNYISRAIRFYPFLKASTVFTGRFVRDNPIQAMVLLQLARQAQGKADLELGDLPYYRRGLFKVGGDDENPLVVDPRAAQMFDVPGQFAELLKGLTSEEPNLALGDIVTPGVEAAGVLLNPRDPRTGEARSRTGALREELGTVPQERFIRSFFGEPDVAEEEGKEMPSSPAIEKRSFLASRLFTPRPLNLEQAHEAAAAAGQADLSPAERAYRGVFAERTEFYETAKRLAPDQLVGGRLPPDLREAFNRKAVIERERARVESEFPNPGTEREVAKLQAEAKYIVQWGWATPEQARKTLAWARTATLDKLQTKRRELGYKYFSPHYLDRISQARTFLNEQGAELG